MPASTAPLHRADSRSSLRACPPPDGSPICAYLRPSAANAVSPPFPSCSSAADSAVPNRLQTIDPKSQESARIHRLLTPTGRQLSLRFKSLRGIEPRLRASSLTPRPLRSRLAGERIHGGRDAEHYARRGGSAWCTLLGHKGRRSGRSGRQRVRQEGRRREEADLRVVPGGYGPGSGAEG